MKKIKTLYLSPVPDFKGGAERSLFDLLANPSIEPFLVVPDEGELALRARSLDIPVEIVEFGSVHNIHRPFKIFQSLRVAHDAWKASTQLRALVNKHKIEIIHTNGLKAHGISILAKPFTSAKIVMHFRDIAYTAQEKMTWNLLTKMASHAIFVSKSCYPKDNLPGNARVVFNGIDPREVMSLSPKNPLRVGFIGRIHPHKGLHTLLDWVAAAKSEGFPIILYIRGKFADESPEYKGEIEEQIKALGLEDVVFFQGFFSDPSAVYKEIDVVCAPAQAAEPLARTILEPMSMGLPVIATATGGTTEMVKDKTTGFIVGCSHDFLTACKIVRDDPKEMLKITSAGRAHINENFSKERLHSNIYRIYCELLDRGDGESSLHRQVAAM